MIRLSSVSKSFPNDHGRGPVIQNVSLEVPEGCLYGLIGPGASGKSVLLKRMVGLLRPEAGTISLGGDEVSALSELALAKLRAKVGMLFQNNALFDSLTVGDNIAFPRQFIRGLTEGPL